MFSQLPAGQFIGIAFYMLLFVAALTSCVGGMAVALPPVRDGFHMSRQRASLVVIAVTTALGIPSALSFTSCGLSIEEKPFLDVMDQLTGSCVVVLAGIARTALISWVLPRARILEAIHAPSRRLGLIMFSARWIILIGCYLPVAAAVLLLIAYSV